LTSVPSGEIEILPTLAGDAKLQGDVNFGDFQLLAQDFGSANSALTASQFASLNSFAAQFGEKLVPSGGGGFSLISVPEPASAGLLTLTAFRFLRRRRRCPL